MALLNPNFADAGELPGLAANWTLSASTALEQIAGFGAAPETAWEDFERWHTLVGDFADLPQVRAFFVSATVGYESFDGGWYNGIFVEVFSEAQLEVAVLGGTNVESFDGTWSNASWLSQWTDVGSAAASFDGEPLEDFEESWHSNEGYLEDWNSVWAGTALFDAGALASETFSSIWSVTASI